MTCSLNTIAVIDNLSQIRAVLLPHLLETRSDNDYSNTETDATDEEDMPSKPSVTEKRPIRVEVTFF